MTAKIWWLIHKDMMSECRARQVLPVMTVLGVGVVLVFALQMDLQPAEQQRLVGGLLWLAIFFAGSVALDRSFSSEREAGCLEGLLLHPIPAAAVYLAKLAVSVLALLCLECVLVPLFVVLSNAPLFEHPGAMLLVMTLGNLGITSVGTLLSAMTCGTRHRSNLLIILTLPLVLPVVLGAAEATRLMIAGNLGSQWRCWVQLLAAFAGIFITAGIVLFEYIVEE